VSAPTIVAIMLWVYLKESRCVLISYRVTHELYCSRGQLFDQLVSIRAYVEGDIAAEIKKPVGELQNF
jgi:hypothetical protein